MEHSATKRARVYDNLETNFIRIRDVQSQVDTLEERIACQKEGFYSGILDVEAHLKVIQDLLQSREDEIIAERLAWKAKVQHLEQKVVAQQRMVDAQQLDLRSQQQEFMARIRDLEMKLTSMEHSLVAAPASSSLAHTPVRKASSVREEMSTAVTPIDRSRALQEYDSQQLALQTLITQQQEMMQELTTAASGHMSADAMALMLQEIKQQGEQQLDLHRQWAARDKELALKEAEARNNHANVLASAAADSAWQYTVQMERSRADMEAGQRQAAEEALDVMKEAYDKLAQTLAARIDQLQLHVALAPLTQQQQQHPSSRATSAAAVPPQQRSQPPSPAGQQLLSRSTSRSPRAGEPATAGAGGLQDAAHGSQPGSPGLSFGLVGIYTTPHPSGSIQQRLPPATYATPGSDSPFQDSYHTISPKSTMHKVNLETSAFDMLYGRQAASPRSAAAGAALSPAARHRYQPSTTPSSAPRTGSSRQASPAGSCRDSCEGISMHSPFDTLDVQHTVCNNPLYEGRAMRTPLRQVPHATPVPMNTLGSAASVCYSNTLPEPALPEAGSADSLDFPSGPPLKHASRTAASAAAGSSAAAANSGSTSSSVMRLSLDQGLAPERTEAEEHQERHVSSRPTGTAQSFSFQGSAAGSKATGQQPELHAAAVGDGRTPGSSRLGRAARQSLLEEFSFSSGEDEEKEQQGDSGAEAEVRLVEQSPPAAGGSRPPAAAEQGKAAGVSSTPLTLRKLRKDRAPMSSLISKFEQRSTSDTPASDAAHPLFNTTNLR